MDIKQDYIHFCLENNEIIEELKSNNTLTYDFLHPIFIVLDHAMKNNLHIEGQDDNDVLDMFSIGFHYLFGEFDNIKRILNENYNEDIDELIENDQTLYLYLRADEIDTLLDSENEMVSAIIDRLLEALEYHKKLDKKTRELIEEELDKAQQKSDETTVTEQFIDFADILDLDII